MARRKDKMPPPLGAENVEYLAACFGSPDFTVEGVADKYDRERLRARIRFQERGNANWIRDALFFDFDSSDGTFEGLPEENRHAALNYFWDWHDEVQAYCRDELRRPLLLQACRAGLLQPFGESK